MKKKKIIILCALIIFAVVLGFVLYSLWYEGVFCSRSSANVTWSSLEYDGKSYISVSSPNRTEGRTIAKDGNWKVKEIEEDPSRTFVVARSFLDDAFYVLKDYTVPTSGKLTKAYWINNEIYDEVFLDAISKIVADKKTTYSFETDAVFSLSDNQKLDEIYLAYENCPVATVYEGYLGTVNGKWVITTSKNTKGTVECYEIPSEFADILNKYFY